MAYKIKKTKKLIKQLQPYWKEYRLLSAKFSRGILDLEEKIEKEIGIKGAEFSFCDNECVGIGDIYRTMELIKMEELEEGKIINYE